MKRRTDYPPISDYALIGNRHTCALVARDGSIDWCCLPHLDSPSVFAAVLDSRRGGRWRVAPRGEAEVQRAYQGTSAVLVTEFRGSGGVLRLTDFLPIRQGRGEELSRSVHTVVRRLECSEGEVEVEVEWMPRPNYARDDVVIAREGEILVATAPQGTLWLNGVPEDAWTSTDSAAPEARFTLRAGERLDLLCGWGDPDRRPTAPTAQRYHDETMAWWEAWAGECCVAPAAERWREMVLRSGMVLKLLTNEASGAIAAAPTASLPEEIGGVRNWDYRFCWVRDASMISQALATLGQREEGIAFLQFLENVAQRHHDPARVQVLYGLSGETRLTEYNLGHLDGYRDSRPVRIGNAAALQRQLDVYGELLQAATDLLRLGARFSDAQQRWLQGVADYVCTVWRWKDRGIWEVRGPEEHFTYSKLMCWVALDRALLLARELGWERDVARWKRERQAIRRAILDEAYDSQRNTFVQSFGGRNLDASNLLIPRTGFLAPDDPRVQGTIDATLRELTEEGLVHRYRTEDTRDGVGGDEGAFGICTFWLVDALTMAGRVDEALPIFEGILARANDLGLYAEEIDPHTGEFLGNFPQAFTHVGLINSTHLLGQTLAGEARPAEREPPGDRAVTIRMGGERSG